MKPNIGNKLFLSGIIVLFFIILIAVAGDIVVRILKRTSSLIVVEYNELEGIQKVSFALSQVLSPVKTYMIEGDQSQKHLFQEKTQEGVNLLDSCKTVLTQRHKKLILIEARNSLFVIDSLGKRLFTLHARTQEQMAILNQMQIVLDNSLLGLQELQKETELEINQYVKTNKTAILHSTITIILLGVILTLIVLIGGYFFIRNLTRPITQLLGTIQLVTQGDMKAKVEISSRDEFGELASAFNSMLYQIDEVTVSRNFYNNILNSMFNGLIVTDHEGKVTSLNDSAYQMLQGTKESLIGSPFRSFFADSREYDMLVKRGRSGNTDIHTETVLKSLQGNVFPILFAGSTLKDENDNIEGYVIVVHDLTESKKIENKINQIRKEQSIAINEAQERERLRIASDLHDGLGQILTSVSFSLQKLDSEYKESILEYKKELSHAMEQIDTAISESKRISHNLIPLALKDFGLSPAITNLVNNVNRQGSIRFSFDTFNFEERIDPRLEKALYRICQEAINNIIKHSSAAAAFIQLIRHEKSIVLVVEDNGIGFNPEEKIKGIGLASIRERVATFGGSLNLQSDENKGTELIIEVPCLNTRL